MLAENEWLFQVYRMEKTWKIEFGKKNLGGVELIRCAVGARKEIKTPSHLVVTDAEKVKNP